MTNAIVIGGGIAGLLAARRLLDAGDRVTLLEAEPELGGAVAAADAGGLEINTGAEAFSIASGSVGRLLAELGLADAVVAPAAGRESRLVGADGSVVSPRGGLLGIPGRPMSPAVRRVLGLRGSLRAWAERFLPAEHGLRPGVTIGDYVSARMGRRVVDRLVAPLVGGVHSADPWTLELDAIQPRLAATVRRTGSLAAAVRELRPSGASAGTAVESIAPTMAELPRALADDLRARGAAVLTGARAVALEHRVGQWIVSFREEGAGDSVPAATSVADRLVLATPPDIAARLLEPVLPDVAHAIPEAPGSPVRLVALVVDAPALDEAPAGTGALVAPGTPGIRAKALTHASAKWDHVREAARRIGPHVHVVRLSYGRPDEELPPADDSIVPLALADASAILGARIDRAQLLAHRTITWERAMRRSAPGHRAALEALTRVLAEHPSLELVGSWRDGTGLDAIVRAHERAEAPRERAT